MTLKAIALGLAAIGCVQTASAELRRADLPPALRPPVPPKYMPPQRVAPSPPMTASSTLARVSPALSLSAPQRSLGAVVPDRNLGAPPRIKPSVEGVMPVTVAPPDPVETRKAATILPIENPRIVRVRRPQVAPTSRLCAKTADGDKKACK